MKVLIVTQHYYPEQFKITDICETLVKKGHEVEVLTGLPNYPDGVVLKDYKWFKNRRQNINGVKVTRAPLIARRKSKLMLSLNYISFAFFASLRVLFLKKDFDLVYVFQTSPVTMAVPAVVFRSLAKKNLYIYCLDLWPQSLVSGHVTKDSLIYRAMFHASRFIYSKADFLGVSSSGFGNYFSQVLGIEKDITYMPMYAEPMFENMQSVPNPDGKFHLLFAGNLGEMQDVETIINAAALLQHNDKIHFDIVGSGSKESYLLEKARGLTNITFHGRFPLEEMQSFYQSASAFLITLKADEVISYTLPNKLQSYMASGKPVFGAIDGEAHKVINESSGCGVAVDSGDYKSLADAILKYHADSAKLSEFGRNGLNYYGRFFSSEIYFENLLSWFEKSANKKAENQIYEREHSKA